MIISSILSTLPLILSIFFLQEKDEDKEKKPENLKIYIVSLIQLLKNKKFLKSMICFSFC